MTFGAACAMRLQLDEALDRNAQTIQQLQTQEWRLKDEHELVKSRLKEERDRTGQLAREKAVLIEQCRRNERAIQEQIKAVNAQCQLRIKRLKEFRPPGGRDTAPALDVVQCS
jgi:hypothetical protein